MMSSLSHWIISGGTHKGTVVVLGGDGIGPEVTDSAVECLEVLGAPIEIARPLHGKAALDRHGTALPDELLETIGRADAVLFGAVDTGPAGYSRSLLRHLRFGLDNYANLRPAVSFDVGQRLRAPHADLVIVRELSEGLYPGCEGSLSELAERWPALSDRLGRPLPRQGRLAIGVVTEEASARVARYAGLLAAHRRALGHRPGHVTIVSKSNVLQESDGLFDATARQVLEQIPDIEIDHLYVDEAARRLVACPESFDVIVTTNLYGDILSDVASEIMGGISMAPSASVGGTTPYFESCHGSAPTLAGKGIANPSATILSAAAMLHHLGFGIDADRLSSAVLGTIASGCKTRDLGGEATTTGFTREVCRRLSEPRADGSEAPDR